MEIPKVKSMKTIKTKCRLILKEALQSRLEEQQTLVHETAFVRQI